MSLSDRSPQTVLPPIEQTITFLPTPNLALQKEFYVDTLGMEFVLDQGVCHLYRAREGSFFGFCERPSTVVPQHETVIDGPILTLVSQEVDAWFDHCVREGVRVDGAPRLNEKYLIYHFFAFDPSGYRVEIQRFEDPRWNSQG